AGAAAASAGGPVATDSPVIPVGPPYNIGQPGQFSVVDQRYLVRGSELFSVLCKFLVRHYDGVISLLMCSCRRCFLNSFIPHRPRKKLALKHNANTIFFGYNVNALIPTFL